MMNKKTLFISDLHLDERYPKITGRFLSFLEQLDDGVEALYILGDFFNVWVGDDDISPFNSKIQSALKKVSKRLPIYFLPGNRDFLIGHRFLKAAGCILLKDPTLIHLYGVPTLLMHGDSLCIYDVKHQRFRRLIKNPLIKYLFLKCPLSFRKKIAQKLRHQSRQHLSCSTALLEEIPEFEVSRMMKKFGVHQMIHGHTHSHVIYSMDVEGNKAQRIVLGDWEDSGSILVCEPFDKDGFLTRNTLTYWNDEEVVKRDSK